LRVNGLISGRVAILEVSPGNVIVASPGDELTPGVRLKDITNHFLVIDNNGRQEALSLFDDEQPQQSSPVVKSARIVGMRLHPGVFRYGCAWVCF